MGLLEEGISHRIPRLRYANAQDMGFREWKKHSTFALEFK